MVFVSKVSALCAALLLPLAPSKAVTIREGGPNGYSAYSQSVYIPYANLNGHPTTSTGAHGPYLNFKIGNSDLLHGQMDTGSTGFVMVGYHIPHFNETDGEDGHIYYSSSGNLLTGRKQNHTITVTDPEGTELLQATMTVLAVTSSCIFKDFQGTGDCYGRDTMVNPTDLKANVSNMIGVGFARGTPPKLSGKSNNLFMRASTFKGETVSDTKMCDGYVIGHKGVTVGLNSTNTAGYSYEKLAANPRLQSNVTQPDWKWKQPSVSFSIGSNSTLKGELLIDTGVSKMYMCVPSDYPTAGYRTNTTTDEVFASPNALVTVDVDGLTSARRIGEQFSMSDIKSSNTQDPSAVVVTTCSEGASPTVNVGRRFLKDKEYLYDAKNGYFGVKL